MKNIKEKASVFFKKYWLYFIFGSITALSQAPLNYTILSIVGFSAFFYLIIQNYNVIKLFWAGHMFGFGYFLFSLSWVGNALLTDTQQFGLFLPFAYLGLPFALAFFYAIAMWCYQKITDFFSLDTDNNKNIIIHLFVFSISLGFFDFLRGHIFTGFPWNLPVYTTVSMSVLMQPSFLFGIYFYNLIWILLASSFSLYKFFKYTQVKKLIIIHYIGISCLAIYGYNHLQSKKDKNLTHDNTIIRIVQPNIAQKIKWSQQDAHNNFNKLLTLSAKNLKSDKKYIFVWPETALPFNPEYDFSAHSQIIDLLNNTHMLITGKMRFVEKQHKVGVYDYYNSIFQISSNGIIKPVFDKVHLVPFGEYLPLRFILEKVGFSQINFFQSEFLAGKDFTPFALTDKVKAAGLICYEAIFPQYSKRIKRNNTDVIINVTNDAWFGHSFGPYQHLVQTQFRAVENQIPIIRSANTGISGFINKNGYLIKSLPLNKTGILDIAMSDIID